MEGVKHWHMPLSSIASSSFAIVIDPVKECAIHIWTNIGKYIALVAMLKTPQANYDMFVLL